VAAAAASPAAASAAGLFWDSYETVPPGAGFRFFSAGHLAWLAGAALACAALRLAYRAMGGRGRRLLLWALALAMLADELWKDLGLLAHGRFNATYLPLHLCSVNMFFCLAFAAAPRPGGFAADALYALCLPGASLALLFPGWAALPLGNFIAVHSFSVHALLLCFPLLPLSAGDLRPRASRLPRVAAFLVCAAPLAHAANRAWGSNFFFVGWPPFPPYTAIDARWGRAAYVASLGLTAALLWALLYLPPYPWLGRRGGGGADPPICTIARGRARGRMKRPAKP
jgi:uncharacterized membrane protein YwaF